MMIFILTFGLIILLVIGLPVAMALSLSSLGALLTSDMPFQFTVLSQKMQYGLQNFILVGIPFFILAAKLMNTSRITEKIFNFANTLVGFLPGGLGHANIVASLIFAGMSGAAVIDAAGLGQIELDAMTKNGYPKDFSVAVTAASSTIGPIFPPSIPLIVYSFVSSTSIGRLFLGGVIPGILMAGTMMIMLAYYAKKYHFPREPFPTFVVVLRNFIDAFLPLMTPVILLGGIWGGFFTPTEAAAVAVFYALIISIFVMRNISIRDFVNILIETARETAVLMFLVAGATIYGWVIMRAGIITRITEWITSISQNPLVILLIIVVFLLLIGCFMEPVVSILILGQPLMIIVERLGIDPIHFGLVMVLSLMIGLLTPPYGEVLFVMVKVSGLKFEQIVKSILPFFIPLFIVLILIIIFPGFVTFLPNLIMGIMR
jgi:tripartite ATP-independent transporter DctM subunit